jgi:hypothetical protein
MNFAGNAMTTETDTSRLDSFKVTKVSDDAVVLTQTIESNKMKMEGGFGGGDEIGKVMQKLEGAALTVTLDPKQQKVVKLEGAGEALKKAFGDNPLLQQFLGGMYGEDVLKSALDEIFMVYLPSKPVNPGDKWTRKSTVSLGILGSLDVDGEYTYKGKAELNGKKLDKIEGVSTLKYVAPKKGGGGFSITKGDMKFDKSQGTYYFDAEAGRLAQMENKVKGKGNLSMSFMGQDLDLEAEVDQTVKARVTDKPPQQRKLERKEDKPTGSKEDK